MSKLYDIYDNRVLIIRSATQDEVKKVTGCRTYCIDNYADTNRAFKNRYIFKHVLNAEAESELYTRFTAEMIREWRTMNMKYGSKFRNTNFHES